MMKYGRLTVGLINAAEDFKGEDFKLLIRTAIFLCTKDSELLKEEIKPKLSLVKSDNDLNKRILEIFKRQAE